MCIRDRLQSAASEKDAAAKSSEDASAKLKKALAKLKKIEVAQKEAESMAEEAAAALDAADRRAAAAEAEVAELKSGAAAAEAEVAELKYGAAAANETAAKLADAERRIQSLVDLVEGARMETERVTDESPELTALAESLQAKLQETEDALRAAETNAAALGSASDACLLYTSPSPRDLSTSRMPSSA